jgi:hypothetical protein
MDDTRFSGSQADSAAAVETPVRPSIRKPTRLGKGLSSLYTPAAVQKAQPMPRPESQKVIERDEFPALEDRQVRREEAAEPQASEAASGADETPAAAALKALADMKGHAAGPAAAAMPSSSSIKRTVADDPRNLFDAERLHRALIRMEAVCSLVIDAERLQQRHVRRALTVAWSAAAVLAVVCGVVLWSAGSSSAWNKAQLDRAHEAAAVARDEMIDMQSQMTDLRRQSQRLAGELETLRSALSKANGVIDELMTPQPAVSAAEQP